LLIELLFAFILISLLIFPLMQYEVNNFKKIEEANDTSVAALQINNFSEVLLTAGREIADWNNENTRLLPKGMGKVELLSEHVCRITLRWDRHKWHEMTETVAC